MVEAYLRRSPLAHLGLEGRAREHRGTAGVAMAERPFQGILDLRGREQEFGAGFEAAFGFALPAAGAAAGKGRITAFRLGPDEWWLVTPDDDGKSADKLAEAAASGRASVTDIGESRACIQVSGPRARDLLAKGCPLDLHPRVCGPGAVAQSRVAKAEVLLHLAAGERARGGPAFDLYVARSFADYLWRWLEDAADEYGLAILRG